MRNQFQKLVRRGVGVSISALMPDDTLYSRTGFGSGLAALTRLWIIRGARPAFPPISASCCSMSSRAG